MPRIVEAFKRQTASGRPPLAPVLLLQHHFGLDRGGGEGDGHLGASSALRMSLATMPISRR